MAIAPISSMVCAHRLLRCLEPTRIAKGFSSHQSLFFFLVSYIVYKMDDAALAKLNIKTLKRYLASYNISTHGMIEKQGKHIVLLR